MSDVQLAVLNQAQPATADEVPLNADLFEQLQIQLDGELRTARHDRMLYATDASIYQVEPLGVVIPRHLQDVCTAVRYAAEHRLPILPRGGGTSLAGQVVNRALVIDFSRHCNQLLDVDETARIATVEPGIVLDHLNAALAPRGLTFGPDVATSAHANVGGMIGNNSAGAHSVVYGRTVEHVRWLDVLLADGTELRLEPGAARRDQRVAQLTQRVAEVVESVAEQIRQRYPKIRRHVDGYNLDLMLEQIERSESESLEHMNLAQLVCGSEGTLAVTLRAGLNLVAAPKTKGLAIVAFDDVASALATVGRLLETGPSAIELIDDVIIHLAQRNNEYRRYVELLPRVNGEPPDAVLYVEYFAEDADELRRRFEALRGMFGDERVSAHADRASMTSAWKLRKAGEPLLHGLPGERKPITFVEDTAVDPHKLVAFVQRFRELLDRHGTTASYYAHASVGCLHIRPLIALSDPNDRQTMQRIAEDVTGLVREFDGALSGEHGDGRLRSHLLERLFGRELCDAFRRIKAIFDPENRLNPGNIVTPLPMAEHLRVRPDEHDVRVPEVQTYYRYRAEGSFAESVKLCNGAGVCRKIGGGTMCPSYWATRDERHATRGRGNALRLAITGQLDGLDGGAAPKWNDEQTLKTLDLCLSCKACKSECPSNVDVAKMKAEYLAQSYDAGRKLPMHVRAFARVRDMNRLGSAVHPLANALMSIRPLESAAKKLMGVDARRTLPRYGPSLYRWHRRRRATNSDGPAVILLPDCFATYNEPHIGRAAIHVLEALGYRVVLPEIGCCGRPAISLGLLGQARIECRDTADALIDAARREDAVAVVGLEPSCVSAIIDDWLDLTIDIDQPALHELAGKTMGIEDFIAERRHEHPRKLDSLLQQSGGDGAPVVLHGHCHQKALWGVDRAADALRHVVGDRLHVLDTGCCGMAGAFGYTADHYDVSMAVAESSLLPKLREHGEAIVLAPGTSCRHQIHDTTGRAALHPVELIERCISHRAEQE